MALNRFADRIMGKVNSVKDCVKSVAKYALCKYEGTPVLIRSASFLLL